MYVYHLLIWDNERGFVRRTIREDLLLECIQQIVKFGGGSVMVWGCISWNWSKYKDGWKNE